MSFERFTDTAKRVMALANQEAQRFNHDYIGTEHILLGIVKEGNSEVAVILRERGIGLREVRLKVEELIKSGPEQVTLDTLRHSPGLKEVINFSLERVGSGKSHFVDVEALFIGLLSFSDSVAVQVLLSLGQNIEEIRSVFGVAGEDSLVSLNLPGVDEPVKVPQDVIQDILDSRRNGGFDGPLFNMLRFRRMAGGGFSVEAIPLPKKKGAGET